jgi:hypothetical protein
VQELGEYTTEGGTAAASQPIIKQKIGNGAPEAHESNELQAAKPKRDTKQSKAGRAVPLDHSVGKVDKCRTAEQSRAHSNGSCSPEVSMSKRKRMPTIDSDSELDEGAHDVQTEFSDDPPICSLSKLGCDAIMTTDRRPQINQRAPSRMIVDDEDEETNSDGSIDADNGSVGHSQRLQAEKKLSRSDLNGDLEHSSIRVERKRLAESAVRKRALSEQAMLVDIGLSAEISLKKKVVEGLSQQSQVQRVNHEDNEHRGKSSNTRDVEWTCVHCTYLNLPEDNKACVMCRSILV